MSQDESRAGSREQRALRRYSLKALAGAVVVALCPAGAAWAADAPLKAVASFSILGDLVREVGGDHVELTTLVGPDGDAHVYEPTPANVRSLSQAQILFVNGLNFESWMPRLVKSSGYAGPVIEASKGIHPRAFGAEDDAVGQAHDADHGHDAQHAHEHASAAAATHDHEHAHAEDHHEHDHDHEAREHEHEAHAHDHDHGAASDGHAHEHAHAHTHEHGAADPHAWQSLGNAEVYVNNIATGLAQVDPAHADEYRRNADSYILRLKALDARLKEAFAAIPSGRRTLVTSHESFGYLGDAYGLKILAPAGVSTDAEPSAATVAAIIRQLREAGVQAVFMENISNPRLVEQISRETGARVGGTLYSDALSKPGQPAATYLDMYEWNTRQILDALHP